MPKEFRSIDDVLPIATPGDIDRFLERDYALLAEALELTRIAGGGSPALTYSVWSNWNTLIAPQADLSSAACDLFEFIQETRQKATEGTVSHGRLIDAQAAILHLIDYLDILRKGMRMQREAGRRGDG